MLKVKYKNGIVDSFPRKASQLRWTLNDPKFCADFDVVQWREW